ncbi:murein biosynthesis integral membrane protein MurJ [Halobacillus sp. Marseille-Q1614]|uniref:murein biosynthesis integral membrane protein MurJ n=1 Tax=Halobacillus sp. Marseille-Q1614 TaxID=2709134 RepID=UPI001570C49F|nr:murein biosynthesis integral membrane protein MurJ [Halobacillus sp. Marseille-Q1614]
MKWIKLFGMVTILSAFGKILGFFREALIASLFGASQTADIFFVAYLIPTILFTALGTGIQAGIIPLYISEKERSPEQASLLIRRLGTFFIFVSLGLTIIAMALIQPLVFLFAPGFGSNEQNLAVILTLIMLPSLLFMTAQSLAQGLLHANGKFGPSAWAPTVNNLGIIVSMFALYEWLGIYGLAWGVLIGSILQIAIQWPWIRPQHRGPVLLLPWKEWGAIKQVIQPFWPIILASLFVQLNGVIDRIVTSFLEEGSVSALNYGNRLLWLPLSILLMPISTILYPQLAKLAARNKEEYFHLVYRGITVIALFSIPVMAVMASEAETLVSFAFERGAFDTKAVSLTSIAFLFFAVALPFFAIRDYLINSAYAVKANQTALRSCIYGVGINIVISASLAPIFGVGGVAFATSLSMLFQSVYLYYTLKQKARFKKTTFQRDWLKLSLVLILTMCGSFLLSYSFHFDNPWLQLIICTLIIFVFYLFLLKIFNLTFLKEELAHLLKRRETS